MIETFADALPGDIHRLAGVLMGEACARRLKLAVAESCTGGLAAAVMTDVEGCSHAFERGFVTYTDEAKAELLGIDPELIKRHTAVSRQVAAAMAKGAIERSLADYALSVTGFAGGSVSALMPLVARDLLHGGAQTYGIMLGAFGMGAVIGALNISEVRKRMNGEAAIRLCALVMGAAIVVVAVSSEPVITAAALKLFPRPRSSAVGFAAVASPAAALDLLAQMQARTGGLVSAFELIPRIALELVLAHIPGTRDPLGAPSPWYVVVEATAGEGVDLTALFETGLMSADDAVVAASKAQGQALWSLREHISEAQKREGASIKHDIAVPVAKVPDFLAAAVPAVLKLAPGARPVSFGHLGDGNLHFNFQSPRPGDDPAFLALWEEMQLIVHDVVHAFGGSISAEHGIGVMKRDALPRYKSHEELDAMRALKMALDPKNILNPGKLVPPVLKL